MHLEKKDFLVLIPATLLALAGLGPDDRWVVGPCLGGSWLSFLWLCIGHKGSWQWRFFIAIIITAALAFVGIRRLGSTSVERLISELLGWITGAHSHWFYRNEGIIIGVIAFSVLTAFGRAMASANPRIMTDKGYLDYKLDVETAMPQLSLLVHKQAVIMHDVGLSINKHTADLQKAVSTGQQVRINSQAASSLDRFSARFNAVAAKYVKQGDLISKGLMGWSSWIERTHPSRTDVGAAFPETLAGFISTMNTSNDMLRTFIASLLGVKGVTQVLNSALDRHIASLDVVLRTNTAIHEASIATLRILNGLD